MQQIQRGIFIDDSYLGVTLGGLVFSHGMILIDAPLRAEDARSWRSALLNQRGGSNRLLINLDPHPDRTLGDRALDTTIVAQARAAQIFRNRPTIFKGQTVETGAAWETYSDAVGMRWAVPDITFSDRMSLYWGGPEIVLESHPGPAIGAIWVIIPAEKVVFVGDAVVLNQPPFLANADLPVWTDQLNVLRENYADFTLISGRGGIAGVDDVHQQIAFLESVTATLDELAGRNEQPEATGDLVSQMLAQLSLPGDVRSRYGQRLRYGLYQYYNRHYRSVPARDLIEEEESE